MFTKTFLSACVGVLLAASPIMVTSTLTERDDSSHAAVAFFTSADCAGGSSRATQVEGPGEICNGPEDGAGKSVVAYGSGCTVTAYTEDGCQGTGQQIALNGESCQTLAYSSISVKCP